MFDEHFQAAAVVKGAIVVEDEVVVDLGLGEVRRIVYDPWCNTANPIREGTGAYERDGNADEVEDGRIGSQGHF